MSETKPYCYLHALLLSPDFWLCRQASATRSQWTGYINTGGMGEHWNIENKSCSYIRHQLQMSNGVQSQPLVPCCRNGEDQEKKMKHKRDREEEVRAELVYAIFGPPPAGSHFPITADSGIGPTPLSHSVTRG